VLNSRIKLIAVDLDYTLLSSGFEVSKRNKEAIARALDRGVAVTLSTGRMFSSALPFAETLELSCPLITYNGAYIRAPGSDRPLSHVPVEKEHALETVRFAAEWDLHCNVYINDRLYMSKAGWEAQMYMDNCKVEGIYEPDLEPLILSSGEQPTKILLIGESGRMGEVKARLVELMAGKAYVTTSVPEYVEIMNKNVSKGRALAAVASFLCVKADEVMAIGDGYNDIDMFRYAGVSVAMGNARDEVKSLATFVAPSNDEDGVAVAIERYVLGSSEQASKG